LCPRRRGAEKQVANHAEGQKPWDGETVVSTAIAIVIVAQSNSLSEASSVASPRCRVHSRFSFRPHTGSTFVAMHFAQLPRTDYIFARMVNADNAPR
jgi:hypothetical protein